MCSNDRTRIHRILHVLRIHDITGITCFGSSSVLNTTDQTANHGFCVTVSSSVHNININIYVFNIDRLGILYVSGTNQTGNTKVRGVSICSGAVNQAVCKCNIPDRSLGHRGNQTVVPANIVSTHVNALHGMSLSVQRSRKGSQTRERVGSGRRKRDRLRAGIYRHICRPTGVEVDVSRQLDRLARKGFACLRKRGKTKQISGIINIVYMIVRMIPAQIGSKIAVHKLYLCVTLIVLGVLFRAVCLARIRQCFVDVVMCATVAGVVINFQSKDLIDCRSKIIFIFCIQHTPRNRGFHHVSRLGFGGGRLDPRRRRCQAYAGLCQSGFGSVHLDLFIATPCPRVRSSSRCGAVRHLRCCAKADSSRKIVPRACI